jgi:cytochrome c biogenesis protein CcdA
MLFAHGMLLGKSHLALRCPKCGGRSTLDRQGPKARIALTVLGVAFVVWLVTSSISSATPIFKLMVPTLAWAAGVLIAFYVFTFHGRLLAISADESPKVSATSLVTDYLFLGLMVAWMYFVYRGVASVT